MLNWSCEKINFSGCDGRGVIWISGFPQHDFS